MTHARNRALGDTNCLGYAISFALVLLTCLLASGAHAQLTYIDQYAAGSVDGMDCGGGPCVPSGFFSGSMPISVAAGENYQSPASHMIRFRTSYETTAFNLKLTHEVPEQTPPSTIFDAYSHVTVVFDLGFPTQLNLTAATHGSIGAQSELELFCIAAANCSSTTLYQQALNAQGASVLIDVEPGRYAARISHSFGSSGDGSTVARVSFGAVSVPLLGPVGTLLLVAAGVLTLGNSARRRT